VKVHVLKPRKGYRRGYPVAILIGLEETCAVSWKIFSHVVKPETTISIAGTRRDPKALYNFHESIINALRPTLKEGVRSILIAAPARTNYADAFIIHVRQHHAWLTQGSNKVAFSEIAGSATTPAQIAALTQTPNFRQLISETTAEETENIIEILEKRLNAPDKSNMVLFSLEEAEKLILSNQDSTKLKPEYLLLTDKYLSGSRQKNRLHRLMQIAANKKIKTRIVDAESPAGLRLTQLGGIVCLANFA
jgi:stalled ribosome rescue protein Dom34